MALNSMLYVRQWQVVKKVVDLRQMRGRVPLLWRGLYFLADLLLFRALKDRLGLLRLRSGTTGGAALGPHVFRFFHPMGGRRQQIYRQTEISGGSCLHPGGPLKIHTLGKP